MKRRTSATGLLVAAVALSLAACNSGPDPLPIHAEVTWHDGRQPAGPYEDDPYVEIVREQSIEHYAAENALNFSGERFNELSAPGFSGAGSLASAAMEGTLRVWEGPPSFTVTGIEEREHEVWVHVCARLSPWWTTRDIVPPGAEVVEEHGDYRKVEQVEYGVGRLVLRGAPDDATVSGTVGDGFEPCDPGDDVAVPTFTTPPDLSLLFTATPDMVFDRDGKRVG